MASSSPDQRSAYDTASLSGFMAGTVALNGAAPPAVSASSPFENRDRIGSVMPAAAAENRPATCAPQDTALQRFAVRNDSEPLQVPGDSLETLCERRLCHNRWTCCNGHIPRNCRACSISMRVCHRNTGHTHISPETEHTLGRLRRICCRASGAGPPSRSASASSGSAPPSRRDCFARNRPSSSASPA